MSTPIPAHLATEWGHIQDVQMTFGTPHGQRVLARLEQDFASRSSFDPMNPRVTDFREGERHVVLVIKARQAMTLDTILNRPMAAITEEETDGCHL